MELTKKLSSAEQVAESLNCSTYTILKWARLGKIPSYKVGRLRRFDLDVVLRILRREMRNDDLLGMEDVAK